MLNALVLGSPRDMRNSHLHHPRVMADGSETHPLTNLERHGQTAYYVTRNFTEGEGGNMPVRNEGKWGGEEGMTRGQLAFGQLRRKTLKASSASSELGLFTGRGAFDGGRSFGGEVMLLARGTG